MPPVDVAPGAKEASPSPKTHRASPTQRLRRLASAARLLEDRRDRLESLRVRLEALAQSDVVVVDGERIVIAELASVLAESRAALVGLEAEGADAESLEQFESLVGPDSWAVLDALDAQLSAAEAALEQARQQVRAALQPWTDRMARDVEPVDAELRDRRAVLPRNLAAGRDRLRSLIQRATKSLNEQQLLDAWIALHQLDEVPMVQTRSTSEAPPVAASQVGDGLREQLDRVKKVSGRVQLTVLRGKVGGDRYEYTLMLLAPGGDRRVGVNVQDTTTIVQQDRAYFLRVLEDVGGGAYRSLRDSRPPDAAPSTAPATGLAELQEMGSVLYKLLVPDRMKDELRQHPEVPLSITTNDLQLPWELMYDDGIGTGSFLCLHRPVTRMPVGRSRGREPRVADGKTTARRVALIASKGTPALPGAIAEVSRIKERLLAEWGERVVDIHVLSSEVEGAEPTGERFREVLLDGGYDIIHYAGHAAFNGSQPDQSGLVLENGEVCFAQKIQRLLQGNPLVFLNACDTARLAPEDRPAAAEGQYDSDPSEGLASAFVYGGALACVGTLWPVNDGVAADFAVAFYRQVFEGQPLGLAMLNARIDTFKSHPEDASAAAFVLYGEPSLQLANPNPLLAPATA